MAGLPTKINSYNVYSNGTKFLGISDEVKLPDLSNMTETLKGAGILGEVDEPVLGYFSAFEIEIPFRTIDKGMWKIASMQPSVNLTLRMSTQTIVQSNMSTDFMPSRIVIKGKNKGFTGGSVKAGSGTKSSIKVEVLYYLIEVDKKKVFELDKLNFVYKVNGKDLLAKVRKQI